MKLRKILNSTLIAGAILLLVGVIVFLVAFGSTGFNLNAFSYVNFETKTYVETGTTTELSLSAETANVYFYEAKEGQPLSVKYTRRKSREGELINDVEIVEEDGRLILTETENSEGRLLLLDITDPVIEIYLPTDRTYGIEADVDVGNVRIVGDYVANTVVLSTKNGSIYTEKSSLQCDVVVLSAINGGVYFGTVNANEATATATNGSVSINGNITTNAFSATTKNGQIYYRSSVIDAANVTLSSSNGNVKAKLRGKPADFSTTLSVENGRSNIEETSTGEKQLRITVKTGTIHIDFEGE